MRLIDADRLSEDVRAIYCDPDSAEYGWSRDVLGVIEGQPTARAQEEPARLLTVEEMRRMPIGAVVWEETHPNELPAGLYDPEERIDPMVKSTWNSIGNVLDNTGLGESEMRRYKGVFRWWSAKPTREQIEGTPWEEKEEEHEAD